jgi:hypothetical protein
VCLLDVPTNTTGTAFTKPVDPAVGDAIQAWEAVRPPEPRFGDRKTGELVDVLLAYRGARIGEKYVNQVLIPLLCRKCRRSSQGRPRSDHRASGAGDDRQPALQRQGPDVAVRAASVARALITALHPASRADHPADADEGLP